MNFTDYLIEEYLAEWNQKQVQAFKDKFGDDAFTNFEKAKDRLKKFGYSTDIQYYLSDKIDKDSLNKLLVSLYSGEKDAQKKKNLEGNIRNVRGKYKYLGEFGGYLVYQPLDYLAAMDLGVNSGWCTSGRYGYPFQPDRQPHEEQAKSKFKEYTGYGIEFYHFLNPKTFYGEYALAVYPNIINANRYVYDKQTDSLIWLSETNYELYNANDDNIWFNNKIVDIARNNLHFDLQMEIDQTVPSKKLQNGFEIKNNEIIKYQGKDLTVVIPNGITTIWPEAFAGGTFKKVIIPNTVTKIGKAAFTQCSQLTSIIIPKGVKSIEDWAFSYCSLLKNITLPSSITKIGESAFYYCDLITDIVIPKNVTKIEKAAFKGCVGLSNVSILGNITRVSEEAFAHCNALQKINFTGANNATIKSEAFWHCSTLESTIIPEGIIKISDYAFYCCENLKEVTLPNSLKDISESAFSHCDSLKVFYIDSTYNNKQVIDKLVKVADICDKNTGEALYEKI